MDRKSQQEERTLAEAFEELRRICEEEDYTLEIPPRQEPGRRSPRAGEVPERVISSGQERMMAARNPLITVSPDRLSGTPVFAGTRVPVQTLIDYLEAGDPLEAFLDDFPSVSREHAVAVLELAKSALLAHAVAA
jgi:uncharacterized protein (DUF433 family)